MVEQNKHDLLVMEMKKDSRHSLMEIIENNERGIVSLTEKNQELIKLSFMISDSEQWFTEELEERGGEKPLMVGRVHWYDYKFNMAHPNDVTLGTYIKRSKVVRLNNNWLPNLTLINR